MSETPHRRRRTHKDEDPDGEGEVAPGEATNEADDAPAEEEATTETTDEVTPEADATTEGADEAPAEEEATTETTDEVTPEGDATSAGAAEAPAEDESTTASTPEADMTTVGADEVVAAPAPPAPPAPTPPAKAVQRARSFLGPRRVSGLGILILGLAILALGLFLLYSLIKLWPAVQAGVAPDATPKPTTTVHLFNKDYKPTPETALLLIVVLAGALGAFLHVATSFSDYVGNRRLMRSWLWFYILRPLVGSGLALLFYFAVRGGLFASQSSSTDLNPYGIAALSAMVGLFSKQATNKLQQIFDTAFAVPKGTGDDARADGIGDPVPTIEGATPATLTKGGDVTITLSGTGFTRRSAVNVAGADGVAVPRTAVVDEDAQTMVVTLDPQDLVEAGTIIFTVSNPEPGGGTSQPLAIDVVDEVGGE